MDPKHSHGPDRIDYQETGDLTEVHAALQREHPEPTAEVTPIPLWLTAICGVAICWAGIYLGLFHGGFKGDVFNERSTSPDLLFPMASKGNGGPATTAEPSLVDQGKSVFANCVACHQVTGLGLPNQFPPLALSEWANGSEKRVIAILLKGIGGPIVVEGKTFNGQMPNWDKTLSDKKIAAVATYVRASFGNHSPQITEAQVAAARKEFADRSTPWTQDELKQIPEDATLPGGSAPPDGAAAPAAGGAAPAAAASPTATATAAAAPAPAAATTPMAPPVADSGGDVPDHSVMAHGKLVYMRTCFACHQPTGAGLPMVFPPIAESPYVNGSTDRFVAIILKGNTGAFSVVGKPYNNVMTAWEPLLKDDEIAQVATYVRHSFGNNAPSVTTEQVAAVRQKYLDRKTPWTQPELDAWPK